MCKRTMAAVVMAATIFIASGFAQAGMVGHVSAIPIGPALTFKSNGGGNAVVAGRDQVRPRQDMKSSEYQGREALETGNPPESKSFEPDVTAVEEIGGRVYRKGVDTGP